MWPDEAALLMNPQNPKAGSPPGVVPGSILEMVEKTCAGMEKA